MAEQTKTLYGSNDFIGWMLSQWRVNKVLPLVSGSLLDISCGDNRLVAKYGSGTGIDVVPHANVDQVLKNYDQLPFDDQSFDTVTIIAALNYFDAPRVTLKEIRRVLKDDGQIIITLLNDKILRVWHRLRSSQKANRKVDEQDLMSFLGDSKLRIEKTLKFMLFMNTLYIIQKV